MDQEYQNIHQSTSAEAASGGGESDFQRLMAASPTLSPLAGWLKCLRKPAISVEYNLTKRHIPDLDVDGGAGSMMRGSNGGTAEGGASEGEASEGEASEGAAAAGKNSDTMGLGGSFTIRYFDFALGILGLAIVGCLGKGCRCLGRKLD